uniref:Cyclic nucleotide-binding domain-containing protein n=1 Tax=Globisporangium ultimum (strain ATCC 200006 / CBS 805.95 / DAOM BR144) TaxID=431595 RepID=K3X6Y4_GLOUD
MDPHAIFHELPAYLKGKMLDRWQRRGDADPQRALQHLSPQLQSEIHGFLRCKVWLSTATPRPVAAVFGSSSGSVSKAFVGFPPFLVSAIVAHLTEQHFFTNEVIYEEFAPGTCMYLIKSREVLLTKHGCHQQQQQQQQKASDGVLHRRAGEFFGASALLHRHSPRDARVVATTSCQLAVLHRDALDALLHTSPDHEAMLHAGITKRRFENGTGKCAFSLVK